MYRVRKTLPEPPALAVARRELALQERNTGAAPTSEDWKLLRDKVSVRAALFRDQGGLCAYCGRRMILPPVDAEQQRGRDISNDMVIEHFKSRTDHPRRMFDWDNLLGVCSGIWADTDPTSKKKFIYTCDEIRRDAPLNIHPVSHPRDPGELFLVNVTGQPPQRSALGATASNSSGTRVLGVIEPQCPDSNADTRILNLNASPLVHYRAAVVRELRSRLDRNDSRANILRLYRLSTTPGPDGLPAYAHVAAAYLRRKLRARNIDPSTR